MKIQRQLVPFLFFWVGSRIGRGFCVCLWFFFLCVWVGGGGGLI